MFMEYYKRAKELMDMDATEFVVGVSDEEIRQAMDELSVAFPESYKAFLADFGGGDAGGEIILGITDAEEENVVKATQMERSVGMPDNFVIIDLVQDQLCCLDTSKMTDGECPVVILAEDYKVKETVAESFGQYLFVYLNEE